jgi:uncharacterized membrane protein
MHKRHLPADSTQQLVPSRCQAEARHSGEVRICVEASLSRPVTCGRDVAHTRDAPSSMFGKLRVWDTEHNNGVLIYLLLAEHAIEIVADRGIDTHVSRAGWQAMVARMGAAFREGRFEDGLTQALEEVSALLYEHFPLAAGQPDSNELPDEPVLG